MVEIKYNGRFGNNLFQFAMGRIIAIDGQHGLKSYRGENWEYFNIDDLPETRLVSGQTIVLTGHEVKLSLGVPIGHIILDGYFQKAKYYIPHRKYFQKLFAVPEIEFQPEPDDVFLHIRRQDFGRKCNGGMLPFQFYKDILNSNKFGKVYISGGVAHTGGQKDVDESVHNAFKEYNPIYINSPSIRTFRAIQKFTNVIQSMSTFCWWATFLSDECKKVYTPITTSGYWSKDSDIDLRVNDEKYIYIEEIDVEYF